MKHKGFYIKELRALGSNKKPAVIKLSKGINILSGGSDTGKSYLLECIDYLFGSKNPPRRIKQSEGYEELRMEIITWKEAKSFTLNRKFRKNKIEVGECPIEEFNKVSTKEYSIKHSSGEGNISKFLLSLCDLENHKLKFNKRNVKKELSFRNLTKICLIDEELIISKISPIHTKIPSQKTLERSLFRLILSGKDDERLEEISDPKIIKNQIKGKLEYIQYELTNKEKEVYEISEKIKGLDINYINLKIDEITGIMNNSKKEVIEGEKEREIIWKEIETITSQKNHNLELKKRFTILRKHYQSDLERLNFINEGGQYLSQLKRVSCPICEHEINDVEKIISNDKLLDSLKKEYFKIKEKQVELQDMLLKLEKEDEGLVNQIKEKKIKFNEINTYIENKLKPVLEFSEKEFSDFINLKEEKIRIEFLQKDIQELNKEKKRLGEDLQKKESVGEIINLEGDLYKKFAKEVKGILSEWGLEYNIQFNNEADDLELNNFPRTSHGKGYRAIFTSAFMLGLLKYCLENSGKHTFFLVLDSPLTTYKEGDILKKGDLNSEQIQENFFLKIKEFGDKNDIQIFIIDNKEPPEDMKSNTPYEHFSKSRLILEE